MKTKIVMTIMLLALSSCGSNESGVDGEKVLTELSEDERVLLCESTLSGSFHDDSSKYICYGFNLAEGDMCETDAAACVSAFRERDEQDCNEQDLLVRGQCTATVAEVEACYSEIRGTFKDFADGLNCSNFRERFEDSDSLQDSVSCMHLEEKCPQFLVNDNRLTGFF
jgi:hypothetical protein